MYMETLAHVLHSQAGLTPSSDVPFKGPRWRGGPVVTALDTGSRVLLVRIPVRTLSLSMVGSVFIVLQIRRDPVSCRFVDVTDLMTLEKHSFDSILKPVHR